jgi:hypothetical protein
MASIINSTTTAGVTVTGDNSGSLQLATNNGTTAVTIDTSQRVAFVAGTVALPAITTTGDTNTGIFFSAADTIDFAENGTATGQFDSSGNFKFNSGFGSVATAYGCRAWVNFNGTGTVAIRASGNVSSITDNGTGAYTVNFTTAMPDANYSGNVSVSSVPGTSDANFIVTDANNTALASPTTTAFSMTVFRFQGSPIDASFVRVAIFR